MSGPQSQKIYILNDIVNTKNGILAFFENYETSFTEEYIRDTTREVVNFFNVVVPNRKDPNRKDPTLEKLHFVLSQLLFIYSEVIITKYKQQQKKRQQQQRRQQTQQMKRNT